MSIQRHQKNRNAWILFGISVTFFFNSVAWGDPRSRLMPSSVEMSGGFRGVPTEKEKNKRRPILKHAHCNPFAVAVLPATRERLPPPPKQVVAVAPLPEPSPPYRFLMRYRDSSSHAAIYLARENEIIKAEVGKSLDESFAVDRVEATQLVVRNIHTNSEFAISIPRDAN